MRMRNAVLFIGILLAALLLALLIYLRVVRSEPEIPPVTLPETPVSETVQPGQSSGPDPAQIIRVDIATVQTVLGTLRRSDSYSRTLTIERFWNGGSSTDSIAVWVQGENLRAVQRRSGDPEKNILIKNGEKWIWYSDRSEVYHASAEPGDADAYQTLLHYEDILSLPQGSIVDAGYVDHNGEECVYVRYVDGPLSYDHCCYISVGTGLLMAEETYDGETLVYAMHSTAPELSTPNEQMFSPPTA